MIPQQYVLGFYFNPDRTLVTLVQKKRPEWQAGFLNGVGGHIEEGETASDAMRREFKEEAGIYVNNWHHFGIMTFVKSTVLTQRVRLYETSGSTSKIFAPTDEEIHMVLVRNLPRTKTIPNLQWLIPLALDHDIRFSDLAGV